MLNNVFRTPAHQRQPSLFMWVFTNLRNRRGQLSAVSNPDLSAADQNTYLPNSISSLIFDTSLNDICTCPYFHIHVRGVEQLILLLNFFSQIRPTGLDLISLYSSLYAFLWCLLSIALPTRIQCLFYVCSISKDSPASSSV